MTDYFEVVVPSKHRKIEYMVRVENDGIAKIIVTGVARPLSFELVFPDVMSQDAFMASDRSRRSAQNVHGRLTLLTPQQLVNRIPNYRHSEQGRIERMKPSDMARALNVPEVILRISERKAWDAVIAWYQSHMT